MSELLRCPRKSGTPLTNWSGEHGRQVRGRSGGSSHRVRTAFTLYLDGWAAGCRGDLGSDQGAGRARACPPGFRLGPFVAAACAVRLTSRPGGPPAGCWVTGCRAGRSSGAGSARQCRGPEVRQTSARPGAAVMSGAALGRGWLRRGRRTGRAAVLAVMACGLAAGCTVAGAPAAAGSPAGAPFVYVTGKGGTNEISQFATLGSGALRPLTPPNVASGEFPYDIAVSPQGTSAYAVDNLSRHRRCGLAVHPQPGHREADPQVAQDGGDRRRP